MNILIDHNYYVIRSITGKVIKSSESWKRATIRMDGRGREDEQVD